MLLRYLNAVHISTPSLSHPLSSTLRSTSFPLINALLHPAILLHQAITPLPLHTILNILPVLIIPHNWNGKFLFSLESKQLTRPFRGERKAYYLLGTAKESGDGKLIGVGFGDCLRIPRHVNLAAEGTDWIDSMEVTVKLCIYHI
jgi:hypothetical protein